MPLRRARVWSRGAQPRVPTESSAWSSGGKRSGRAHYTAILCRRTSSASTLRCTPPTVADGACTLRRRPSNAPREPALGRTLAPLPNSASACAPSLSSSSSAGAGAYERDFFRRIVAPAAVASASASRGLDEDDREERTGTGPSSSALPASEARFESGAGSGLRIFLEGRADM